MHMTMEQQIAVAYEAWDAAASARDKIGRKMGRLEKKNYPMGPDYVRQGNEMELCRVQYAALNELQVTLWSNYKALEKLAADIKWAPA